MHPTYPSATTLLPVSRVAEIAGIATPTLYSWLERGVVVPTHEAAGRPLFTKEAAQEIAALAEQRRELAEQWRLPKVSA